MSTTRWRPARANQQDRAEEAMFPAVEVDGQTIDPLFNINRPDERP
jgi:hypothetical protein